MESRAAEAFFSFLSAQNRRPAPFSTYTAQELWTDPHIAEQMLLFHLDPDKDLASRNHAFIERSISWLNETFDLSSGKRVLDLGCGPGLYTNGLAELGASVTGVDFSATSLAHARSVAAARGLNVVYHQANYLDLQLEQTFDIVLLIFGDFCPLGPGQRRCLLDNVRRWLAPGGRFVFDVSSSALFEGVEESADYETAAKGGFWSPEPYFLFTHRFKYPADMAYLDRYVVIEPQRQRELFNWIQCYDPARLEAELRDARWEVESTFGNVAGDPWDPEAHFFAVVARPTDL
jgi:SAM-dependent methyltransferase